MAAASFIVYLIATNSCVAFFIGLSGISFARFYLDIHPRTKLAILEADDCVGGVWSSCK